MSVFGLIHPPLPRSHHFLQKRVAQFAACCSFCFCVDKCLCFVFCEF